MKMQAKPFIAKAICSLTTEQTKVGLYSLIESYDLRQDLSADSIYLMMELVPMDTDINRRRKKGSD